MRRHLILIQNSTCSISWLLTACFLGICLLFFSSCSQKSEDKEPTTKVLQNAENKLRIPLDDQTGNYSFGLGYLDGEKPFLFNIQHQRNEIQVYDLGKKELSKILKFEVEGSNGIGSLRGFHVHTADSIFLFTSQSGAIFLTDLDQSYLSRISFASPGGYSDPGSYPLPFNASPIIRSERMLSKTAFPGSFREIDERTLSDKYLSLELNLRTGDLGLSAHRYPIKYLADGLRQPTYSMAASPEKVVYSFFADHNLYVASSARDELKAVNAKSRFFPETFPTIPRTAERNEVSMYVLASPRYEGLIYDRYREVFYRFCFPAIEVESEEELEQLRGFPKDFSIMILDSDLQVLGETRFKGYNYVTNNVFVAKEGLYISVNHPDNYDNEEDFLSFVLYELADAKK